MHYFLHIFSGEAPSQALPRQLSRRESQAVNLDAKALGTKRRFPAVLLALPLGELAKPEALTERAHAVNPVLKYQTQQETFPPCQRLPPRGSWQNRQVLTEGVQPSSWGRWIAAQRQDGRGNPAPYLQIKIASFLRFTAIFSNFTGM